MVDRLITTKKISDIFNISEKASIEIVVNNNISFVQVGSKIMADKKMLKSFFLEKCKGI